MASSRAWAARCPTPAAPPMTRTVNRCSSRPNRRRSACFSPGAGGRNRRSTGRPSSLTRSAGTRRRSATRRARSVGATTRSAWLNVQPRWKSTRSVITVIRARGRPLFRIAWWATWFSRGCTDSTTSGSCCFRSWRSTLRTAGPNTARIAANVGCVLLE